jgi:uncharacterized membrane protein
MALGRVFFATGLLAWGIQHFASGGFVTRVVPYWPAGIPGRALGPYLVGAALVAAGTAILTQLKARAAALAFSVLAFLSFGFLHLPVAAGGPLWGGAWTSAGKALVMCGGALCLAVYLAETEREPPAGLLSSPRARDGFVLWGRVCLGAFMMLCGIQHFMFAGFVATLVPPWIPGALFWTYFAGVALIAGGAGLILPYVNRMAAMLSGAIIFAWVFLVHIPLVVKNPQSTNDVAAVFEALAFSGVAFLLAGLAPRRGAAASALHASR